MRIEDVEVGKWYWFSRSNEYAFCEKVVTKDETRIVSTYAHSSSVWSPDHCIGEAYERNNIKEKDKSWRSLWGLMQ